MPKRNRGDRGALVALAMLLAAVVVASFFGFVEEAQRQANHQSEIANGAQKPEYNPWQDPWSQWAMAVFAGFATAISILAVLLLYRTLAATRAALTEARNTTKAAIEHNDLIKEERRPWLAIETPKINTYPETNSSQNRGEAVPYLEFRPDIEVRISNGGTFPARRVKVHIHIVRKNIDVSEIPAGLDRTGMTIQEIGGRTCANVGAQAKILRLKKYAATTYGIGEYVVGPQDDIVVDAVMSPLLKIPKRQEDVFEYESVLLVYAAYHGQNPDEIFSSYVVYDFCRELGTLGRLPYFWGELFGHGEGITLRQTLGHMD